MKGLKDHRHIYTSRTVSANELGAQVRRQPLQLVRGPNGSKSHPARSALNARLPQRTARDNSDNIVAVRDVAPSDPVPDGHRIATDLNHRPEEHDRGHHEKRDDGQRRKERGARCRSNE
jgi:hypothetical protein